MNNQFTVCSSLFTELFRDVQTTRSSRTLHEDKNYEHGHLHSIAPPSLILSIGTSSKRHFCSVCDRLSPNSASWLTQAGSSVLKGLLIFEYFFNKTFERAAERVLTSAPSEAFENTPGIHSFWRLVLTRLRHWRKRGSLIQERTTYIICMFWHSICLTPRTQGSKQQHDISSYLNFSLHNPTLTCTKYYLRACVGGFLSLFQKGVVFPKQFLSFVKIPFGSSSRLFYNC